MTISLDERLPSVFPLGQARALGLSERQVYAWRDNGDIEVLGHGIFAKPGIEMDQDLVEISVRAPLATLCLTSALARYELIDDIPTVIDVALPREHRQPRSSALARWHRFDTSSFYIDRTQVDIGGGRTIGIYGPGRCIIDAFRLRHLYGTDQAVAALRRWLNFRGSQPAELLRLAGSFPVVERPLRQALEILL
jgi:predicted transcriptional regulator of viral defense system